MSSDYLNYELSKELHDLGVEFEKKMYYIDSSFSTTYPDECLDKSKLVVTPSTAQLIDELRKYSPIWITLFTPFVRIDLSETKTMEPENCATTALGKALIALVKEDKKCTTSKTS